MLNRFLLVAFCISLFSISGPAFAKSFDGPHVRDIGIDAGLGTYEVTGTVPNGCYGLVGVVEGAPPSVGPPIVDSTIMVTMTIKRTAPKGKFCTSAIKPLNAQVTIETAQPPQRAMGFMVLGDEIVSVQFTDLAKVKAASSAGPVLDSREWRAWINAMPGSVPSLHVTGEVQLASKKYEPHLSLVSPQGTNPNILLLKLEAKEKSGIWSEVVHWNDELHFTLAPAFEDGKPRYSQVQILLDGQSDTTTLDVELVQ